MDDIFGPGANLELRVVKSRDDLVERLTALRKLHKIIGLTSGTYDLAHVGHYRYLALAKKICDVLVVGVDTDARVKKRKGSHRPFVSENERFEILCHSRYVDLVVPKEIDDSRWQLIKTVIPDVLIISEREYSDEQELQELTTLIKELGGKIVILPSQSETSTTAQMRRLLIEPIDNVKKKLAEVMEFLNKIKG